MGYIKEEIKKLIKGKGRSSAAKEQMAWFESGLSNRKEKSIVSVRSRFISGKIYVFEYSPITKDLEWFDENPVVLALDPYDGDDIGINLSLLPPNIREDLLDEVYTRNQSAIKSAAKITKNADKQRGLLRFSYEGAKRYLELKGFDFAIRRYKPNRKSKQAVITYKDWCKVALVDFHSLNGVTKNQLARLFEDHRRKRNI